MSYAEAKAKYAALGIDTDAAMEKLRQFLFLCTAGRVTMCGALTQTPPSP